MGSSLYLSGGLQTTDQLVKTVTQVHTFAKGDVLRWDGSTNQYVLARANSAVGAEVVGVVSDVADATQFTMVMSGYIDLSSVAYLSAGSFTDAPVLFLSADTAGQLNYTPPSVIGSIVKPVLVRNEATGKFIVNNFLGTQIGGSSTVAIDEIQPVGTIMPFSGTKIPDTWLACDGVSYAIASYPELYNALLFTTGDRTPMYGYVAELTGTGLVSANYSAGQIIQFKTSSTTQWSGGIYDSNADVFGLILSVTTNTSTTASGKVTVQVLPKFQNNSLSYPNTLFRAGTFTNIVSGASNYRVLNTNGTVVAISTTVCSSVALVRFNTPDLRGRFAVGSNTTELGELESSTNAFNSAVSGNYALASIGGQESTIAATQVATSSTTGLFTITTASSNTGVPNVPPYVSTQYIVKAKPYTRAAIIDGIDVPYTQLLVTDLRDGTLRPGGSGEDLLFKTNNGVGGTERMRLKNNGILQMSGGALVMNQSNGVTTGIILNGVAANTSPYIKTFNPDNTTNKYSFWSARDGHSLVVESSNTDGDSGTVRFLVTESGNAAVGTTAVSTSRLHVENGTNAAISFGSVSAYGTIKTDAENNTVSNAWSGHIFQNGGVEKLRITSTGSVGVGTATPGASLDVNGSAVVRGTLTTTGTATVGGTLNSTGLITASGGITVGNFATSNVMPAPQGGTISASNPTQTTTPNPAVGQTFRIDITTRSDTVWVGRTGQTWLCIAKGGNTNGGPVRAMAIRVVTAPQLASGLASDMGVGFNENMNIIGWRIA